MGSQVSHLDTDTTRSAGERFKDMEDRVRTFFSSSEEEDNELNMEEMFMPEPEDLCICCPSSPSQDNVPRRQNQYQYQSSAQLLLSNAEVTDRMRTLFERSLQLHLDGDYLQACDAVSTALFPHQMFALAWMANRENHKNLGMKGGILADDMGLGKTLSILALILTNFHDGKPMARPEAFFKRMLPRSALRYMPDPELLEHLAARRNPASLPDDKSWQKYGFATAGKQPIKKQKLLIDSGDDYSSTDEDEKKSDSISLNSSFEDQGETDINQSTCKRGHQTPILSKIDSDDVDRILEIPSNKDESVLHPRLNLDGATHLDDADSDSDFSSDPKRPNVNHSTSAPRVKRSRQNSPFVESQVLSQAGFELPDVEVNDNDDGIQERFLFAPETVNLTSKQQKKLRVPPKEIAPLNGRRKATLIVTPASLIGQWLSQIELHVSKSVDIDVFVHYGTSKALIALELQDKHIVLTTYGTLMAEFKDNMQHGPLLRVKWLRVVLDEGHLIKNHLAKTFKAAKFLNAERKWIVSGTPIQNNLTELWALLNWLEEPNYGDNRPMFRHQIERPINEGHPRGVERLQVLMEAICLRRTKTDQVDGKPLVSLPAKTVNLIELDFTEEERIIYDAYHSKGKELIIRYIRRGTLLKNYAHVFAVMMRLRQLCCHKELLPIKWNELDINDLVAFAAREMELSGRNDGVENSDEERKLVDQLRRMIKDGMSDECSICLSEFVNPVITPCAHVYCRHCITQHIESVPPPAGCPLCRGTIKVSLLLEAAGDEENEEAREAFEDIVVETSSTKVMAAMKELEHCRRKNADEKVIICSQFTSLLSIFQPLLTGAGFEWTRLDGTMSIQERLEVISSFQSEKKNSPKVLLLSLRAGGVGLNLTAANRLILLDPAWNPSTEEQCFDRIHRLGQTKEVRIVKFVMKDSIEQRMQSIQDKKRNLISGAFRQTEHERRQQRIQDIRDIFGI